MVAFKELYKTLDSTIDSVVPIVATIIIVKIAATVEKMVHVLWRHCHLKFTRSEELEECLSWW